jgi:Macrocin-O-methyltransferase (TylF)
LGDWLDVEGRGPIGAASPRHRLVRLQARHELVHLCPRLSVGGVLIIDDYGDWEGCRQAVDEHFSEAAAPVLLTRIDYTGRIGVKL